MQSKIRFWATVLVCVFLISSSLTSTIEATGDVRVKLARIYSDLVNAESAGADISVAATKLDEARRLIASAESANEPEKSSLLAMASVLIGEVEAMIPELMEAGRAATLYRSVTTIASVAISASSAIFLYIYGPRILWRLWLRSRKGWRVRRA